MSAADVERIADVVVEFVPGDRELAERIAGAVWGAEAEVKAEALRDAADEWFAQSKDTGWRFRTRQWLRDRADALSGAQIDGHVSEHDQSPRAADRQPRGQSGALRGHGDGTSEGEKR